SPHGVAVDRSGDVFVADAGNNAVKEIPLGCVSAACVTTLGGFDLAPLGIAVDGAGNVYVADDNALTEIPPGCVSGACVATLALGVGFSSPRAVAVDGSGNVFVAGVVVVGAPPG